MSYRTSVSGLLDFVHDNQIVAESAKGLPVPSLVRHMVGEDYSGGWWSLKNSSTIFNALQLLRERQEVLVCRLAKGKVTFVYEDSLLPLASLSERFPAGALDKFEEQHLPDGRHASVYVPVDVWWSTSKLARAPLLSEADALARLDSLVPGLGRTTQKFYERRSV